MKTSDSIVADGRERLLKSVGEREIEIKRRIEDSYRSELASAGWWRRLVLKYRIKAEIARELEKIAPRQGLYLRHSKGHI